MLPFCQRQFLLADDGQGSKVLFHGDGRSHGRLRIVASIGQGVPVLPIQPLESVQSSEIPLPSDSELSRMSQHSIDVVFRSCLLLIMWLPAGASAQSMEQGISSTRYGGHSMLQQPWLRQPAAQTVAPQPAPSVSVMSPEQLFAFPPDSAAGGFVRLDAGTTQPLLDFVNRQTDKEILLMYDERRSEAPELLLGAQFRPSALLADTNTTGKYSYLGRFPTDFVGHTATDARLLHANQAFVGRFSPWATGYMETLFSDVFTFPTSTQGSFQMRQAYVTFGNLTQSPWYAFIGKKTVNFGDMGTLSPFTQSMVWHYFSPLAEGVGGGFAEDGFSVSVTALNGSRGIRVADSEEKGHINNFAGNLRYEVLRTEDATWALGAGYLHGTIYDGSVAEHTNPQITGPRNPAWDANSSLVFGPWRLEAELARTFNDWPVTDSPVVAWRAETAYDFDPNGRLVRLSGSWSEGLQGPAGSEFEFNRQLVLGLRYDPRPNVMVSFEYVRSLGFAPLIDITTVSDRNVVQNSFVLGLVLTI